MIDKRDQEVAKMETVQETIGEMLEEETFIDNVQQVRNEVQRRHQLEVSVEYVRQQFKAMNIKYMKVKQVAPQANSDRSLVLRQRWAMNFLEQDWRHKNVVNIDETWLGMCDFRRMHWRPGDRNYSTKVKGLTPRISMITAVDKMGNVWLALTMSNSNQSMMGMFMEHFCRRLEQQNPYWRSNTVLLWDGK